jgi:LysM domain
LRPWPHVRRWKQRIAILALCSTPALASVAHAQNTSDLMPALPQPPSGQRVALYPGQPAIQIEQPGAAGSSMTAPGGKTVSPGRTGYDIYDTTSISAGYDRPQTVMADQVPEIHTVVRGDTLWGISGYYFRNPWTWPRLWALNPTITNPHWIYPGDVVRLMAASAQVTPERKSEEPVIKNREPVRADGVFLRQTGFVDPDELKHAAKIVGSKEEKIFLSTLDEIYVEMNKERPLHVGERYTVYRVIDEVKHPVTNKKLGHMVEILGETEIRTVTDGHIARGKLIDSLDPIERGYFVGPLRRQFKLVDPTISAHNQVGVIVAALKPISYLSADNLIFIDKGKLDGVTLGNKFLVTRRGDGYREVLASGPLDDRRFPREVMAEAIIVDLRDHIATALVTHSTQEVYVGDQIEARAGH